MTKQKKIILFTNSEYGQANVVLATAYELLLAGCDVHIASYVSKGASLGTSIPERVSELNEGSYGPIPKETKPVTFHCIKVPSMTEAMIRKGLYQSEFVHGPGVREALRMYPLMLRAVSAWEPDEYVHGVESCVEILRLVDPDFIVIERLCAPAVDTCTLLSRKYAILSPNTFKETLAVAQPYLFSIWGIPADCSGFQFPVPWYLRPLNVLVNIYLIICMVRSSNIKAVNAARKVRGLTTMFPFMVPYDESIHYLIPTALECDFRFPCIPENVTCCGPILLGSPSISEVDPELETWLQKGPTVLLNLGSNKVSDSTLSRSLATAMRDNETIEKGTEDILSKEIQSGRVRIRGWLKAEPGAMLRSGLIVCSVHHGGANSYYEAVNAGVPQIVLPLWFDTYEFAHRVENLGIGINGSKHSAPNIDPEFLGNTLVETTDEQNEKGRGIKTRAKDLAKVMERYKGRKAAADKILEVSEL